MRSTKSYPPGAFCRSRLMAAFTRSTLAVKHWILGDREVKRHPEIDRLDADLIVRPGAQRSVREVMDGGGEHGTAFRLRERRHIRASAREGDPGAGPWLERPQCLPHFRGDRVSGKSGPTGLGPDGRIGDQREPGDGQARQAVAAWRGTWTAGGPASCATAGALAARGGAVSPSRGL